MSSRAVILARGLGTRMRRHDPAAAVDTAQATAAANGAKAMMPVGRPLVEHLLTAVADADLQSATLVIGPEHAAVRAHFRMHPPRRLSLDFAEQRSPLGTADAVAAAEPCVGESSFLVLNGDTWYPPEAIRAVACAAAPAFGAFDAAALLRLGNITEERLLAFALCDVGPDGLLRDIIEKPSADHRLATAKRRAVSMNLWHLPRAAFAVLRRVRPSARGELELVDAVRSMLANGVRVHAVPLATGALDLSTRHDIAAVTALLADRAVDY